MVGTSESSRKAIIRYDAFSKFESGLASYMRDMGYSVEPHSEGLILSTPVRKTTWAVHRLVDADSMSDLDAR